MKDLAKHYYFIPQIIAVMIVAPLSWMAFDRTPPLALYDGVITPNVVRKNQAGVKLVWRARFSGRDCPGLSQREFVDSIRGLWPQLAHSRAGIFVPDPGSQTVGTVTTPPLMIPDMAPGPATYQVTQFYYCNWLQRFLHWPIVQPSPYVRFEVAP
jgi:hypothetical protein